MESKRQSDGAVLALRLHQAFDALLTERLGVQSQMIEPAEGSTEDIAANGHRFATGPIDEFAIANCLGVQ